MPGLEYLPDFKNEIRRLLTPIGKIVIIASRVTKIDANEELTLPKETIAAFLYPEFQLLEQNTEGRLGASAWLFLRKRLRPKLLLRPVAILLAPILYSLDAIDTTNRFYVTSLTVAQVAPTAG